MTNATPAATRGATYRVHLSSPNLSHRPNWRAALPTLPAEWWETTDTLLVRLPAASAGFTMPRTGYVMVNVLATMQVETKIAEGPAPFVEDLEGALKAAVWQHWAGRQSPNVMAAYAAGDIDLPQLAARLGKDIDKAEDREWYEIVRHWAPRPAGDWVRPAPPAEATTDGPTNVWPEEDQEPDEWVAAPVLDREYVTQLVAPSGTGKTLWALGLCMSIVSGRDRYGPISIPAPCPVLYVGKDDVLKRMNKRYHAARKALGLDQSQIADLQIWLPKGKVLLNETLDVESAQSKAMVDQLFINQLRKQLERLRPGVLVLDPLMHFHNANENDNTAMNAIAGMIVDLARQYHCAVLVVHHPAKGYIDQDDANSGRGASSFAANTRTQLNLLKQGKDKLRLTHAKASNSETMDDSVWRFAKVQNIIGETVVGVLPLEVDAYTWEHRAELLEMVRAGRGDDGHPWATSERARKEYRLDVAIDERWGGGHAEKVLPAFERAGVLRRVTAKPGRTAYEAWEVVG